jgi:guanine deaminase
MTDAPLRQPNALSDEDCMRAALAAARRGLLAGEPPVGACLVRDGEIIVTANNAVIGELDATAHAEIRVIREACRQLRSLALTGATLYATVEPCPMCLSACHYAGVEAVVFGAALEDMQGVTGVELEVHHATLAQGGMTLTVTGECLADESRALIAEWSARFKR